MDEAHALGKSVGARSSGYAREAMSDASTNPPPRATLTSDYQRDWPAYFDAVKDQPPRATCVMALDAFARERAGPGLAIDLACGEGRDTRAMLARGWQVVAVDSSGEGLMRLRGRMCEQDRARVREVCVRMEDAPSRVAAMGVARVDFVNASFALPFCEPGAFLALWRWVEGVIRPGGRFAGQLFGDRDEWRNVRPASHYTRAEALELLREFELEHFEEVEKDGSDAMGGVKHHHLYHIVGRRLGA